MFFRSLWIWTLIIFAIGSALSWISYNDQPQDVLYNYRVSITEPIALRLLPTGISRDAYIIKLVRARFEEVLSLLVDAPEDALPPALSHAFGVARQICVDKSGDLVVGKKWCRGQDLAAQCLAISAAYEQVWRALAKPGTAKDTAFRFLEDWKKDALILTSVRAQGASVSIAATDRTDFLAGLETELAEMNAVKSVAISMVESNVSLFDKPSQENMRHNLNFLNQLAVMSKRNFEIGNYREAWWQSSEARAVAAAISIEVDSAKKWQLNLSTPLVFLGFTRAE